MQAFAYAVRPLLLRDHCLEAAEVVELPPRLDGGALLREGRLLPLLDDRLGLDLLLDDAAAGATGELGEAEGCEGEVAVGEGLPWDAGCGSVNDGLCKETWFSVRLNAEFGVH